MTHKVFHIHLKDRASVVYILQIQDIIQVPKKSYRMLRSSGKMLLYGHIVCWT